MFNFALHHGGKVQKVVGDSFPFAVSIFVFLSK